jgi:hypothetical protein
MSLHDRYREAALNRPCTIIPQDISHGGAHVPAGEVKVKLVFPAASRLLVSNEINPSLRQAAIDSCQSARLVSLTNAAAFEQALLEVDTILISPPNPNARSIKFQEGFDLRPEFLTQMPHCPDCPHYYP